MKNHKPIVGITMGDPAGIGPEIILKSFKNDKIKDKHVVVIGDFEVMKAMMNQLNLIDYNLKKVKQINECEFNYNTLNILDLNNVDLKQLIPGKVQAMAGNAAFEYVKKATELALDNSIQAIATAPLNKEAMHLAGYLYPGHTEILANLSHIENYGMLLYDEKLKVIHVSTHVSLLNAIKNLNKERIANVIQLAYESLRLLGYDNPHIGVAGINPHAGEGGIFGDEEIREIIPAIAMKREEGIMVEGPESPDTVFLRAFQGEFDIVVAMYHDQGHIPLKLLGFYSGVNITVGLPFIRTSVDHGTAFDRAWKGISNEDNMIQAIKLAVRFALNQ